MNRLHFADTRDANMLYLLKYRLSDEVFFLEVKGKQYVFLNVLEIDAFKEEGNREVEVVDMGPLAKRASQQEGNKITNLALLILQEYGVEGEILVPANFPVKLADEIRGHMPQLTAVEEWCPERRQKSPEEISAIRENFEHTKKAYELIETVLSESEIEGNVLMYRGLPLTSEFLKKEVRKLLLEYDLECTEGLIISGGKQAAMPHHEGSGLLRPGETIIVDIFPQSTKNHYFADMTRTYVKGVPLYKEVTKMYEAVKAAQDNACKALRPGVSLTMPYEISAGIIERAGFDVGEKGYVHSLGHGLGLAIHEAPNLSARAAGELQVGDVVTVEPGLYYPEWGGVRIEDTVVITEDGYEDLTDYPQNWLIS